MKQFKTKIILNKKIAADHYILSFKMKGAGKIVKPGQFFNIKINDGSDPLLRRPFGAHKIEKDKITILYKVVGNATKLLSLKKTGEKLDVLGPLGNGFTIPTPGVGMGKVVLMGGGHGIAPLQALAEELNPLSRKRNIAVFIGARGKNHIVCEKEFKELGAKAYIATEDGSKGHKGFVTDLLKQKLSIVDYRPSTIYACGPKPMLKAIAKIANKNKIPCQISMEEYLGCGIGICMGCAVKTYYGNKLVCKDGPVFDSKEIIWQGNDK